MLKSFDRFADWIAFVLFEDHQAGPGFQGAQPASVAARIAIAFALAVVVSLMTALLVLGLAPILDLTPFSVPDL